MSLIVDSPFLSLDVVADDLASVPGFAICLTNPAAADDVYWHFNNATFFDRKEGALIAAGFSDLTDQFWFGSNTGRYSYFGSRQDAGTFAVGQTILGGRRPFAGLTHDNYASLLRQCPPDYALLAGLGADPDGSASMLTFGNKCEAKAGYFPLNGSAGGQAVTGVGFQPDLVIFLGCFNTVPPGSKDGGSNYMMGAMDAAGNQWVGCTRSQFYSGGFERYSRWRTNACIAHVGAPGYATATTYNQEASFSSMDADGFTINLSAAGQDSDGTSMSVLYLAVKAGPGGAFKVGNGSQGDTTLTAGFAPEVMLFFSTQLASAAGTDSAYCYASQGCLDATKQRNYWEGTNADPGGVIIDSNSYTSTSSCLRFALQTLPTLLAEAVGTLTGTGATLNWTTDDGGGRKFGWVAFKVDTDTSQPEAETGTGTPAGAGSATLRGTVTPNRSLPVSYFFEWGPTLAFGNQSAPAVAGSGFAPIDVSAVATPISPGWYFRLVVVDPYGCETPGGPGGIRASRPQIYRRPRR